MSHKKEVLLKKAREHRNDTHKRYLLGDIEELLVGGQEGKKYQGSVVLKAHSFLKRAKEFLGLRAKRKISIVDKNHNIPSNIGITEVKEICLAYAFLRKNGYLVPGTSRYYVDETNHAHLVLSDMTQGGKKRIWGFSDFMTKEQDQELAAMNLTDQDVEIIRKKAIALAHKANRDKIRLYYPYFHILQDKQTRGVSVCLLDISSILLEERNRTNRLLKANEIAEYNLLQANIFIGDVGIALNWIQKQK